MRNLAVRNIRLHGSCSLCIIMPACYGPLVVSGSDSYPQQGSIPSYVQYAPLHIFVYHSWQLPCSVPLHPHSAGKCCNTYCTSAPTALLCEVLELIRAQRSAHHIKLVVAITFMVQPLPECQCMRAGRACAAIYRELSASIIANAKVSAGSF
jgi:hypothetical protein